MLSESSYCNQIKMPSIFLNRDRGNLQLFEARSSVVTRHTVFSAWARS